MPTLRRVTADDMDQLFMWANDVDVRNNAYENKPIAYERHISWFNMKLYDRKSYMYIYEEGCTPIGQIRFDLEGTTLEVDVSIDKEHRGCGHGTHIIRYGTLRALNDARASYAVAYVLQQNSASLRAFIAAGYNYEGIVNYMGKQVHKLQYTAGGINAC